MKLNPHIRSLGGGQGVTVTNGDWLSQSRVSTVVTSRLRVCSCLISQWDLSLNRLFPFTLPLGGGQGARSLAVINFTQVELAP